MACQMIRVISSPSSSTTGFATLILLIKRSAVRGYGWRPYSIGGAKRKAYRGRLFRWQGGGKGEAFVEPACERRIVVDHLAVDRDEAGHCLGAHGHGPAAVAGEGGRVAILADTGEQGAVLHDADDHVAVEHEGAAAEHFPFGQAGQGREMLADA